MRRIDCIVAGQGICPWIYPWIYLWICQWICIYRHWYIHIYIHQYFNGCIHMYIQGYINGYTCGYILEICISITDDVFPTSSLFCYSIVTVGVPTTSRNCVLKRYSRSMVLVKYTSHHTYHVPWYCCPACRGLLLSQTPRARAPGLWSEFCRWGHVVYVQEIERSQPLSWSGTCVWPCVWVAVSVVVKTGCRWIWA